tara:strand:+ start:159 stop:2639 length:2481 start_codon:yes stop_codon:yes gene_type:complete
MNIKKALTFIALLQTCLLMAQTWEQVASVPDNYRTDHSYAFSIDDVGYMVSGNTENGPTSDFFAYDANADMWFKKTDFPGASRGFAIGDVINGKAYFGFGNDGSNALNDFWEYDPATDMWTELASCDCAARTHPAMVALDGFVYLGLGGGGGNKKDWWAYDIENDIWDRKADFPAAERHHPFQFTDGEYVYVGNGHGNGFISNEWYQYDTAQDTWMQVATMPSEGRVAGTQLSHKGFGYVLSGDGDNHAYMETGELWKYDSEINSWIEMPPHPGKSRWAPASFIINDEIYIINGWNGVDGFLDNVYKLDLSVFSQARLRLIMPNADLLDYQSSDEYCDAFATTEIGINSPIAFDVDAMITLSVDPSSSAVAGEDFIFDALSGTLTAGEFDISFGLTLFNDAVVSGDKTLVINLTSDQLVETPQSTFVIIEDDLAFDTSVTFGSANVGVATTSNPNVFGQYYTNMRTQMIYRNEMLTNSGLIAGDISKISFNLEEKGSLDPYLDFTVYMANTNVNELNNGINNGIDFQEVFRGTITTAVGVNDIRFDTPFAFDGTSNIALQFCFDNAGYTNDDLVSAYESGYASSATLKIDNINGCPNSGNSFDGTTLPVITFGEGKPNLLYSSLDRALSSSIGSNESVYLEKHDSILMSIKANAGSTEECVNASLLSNTNALITENGVVWQDKVYYIEQEGGSMNDYTITLILPNTGEIDWNSADLTGLYIDQKLVTGDIPVWETREITNVIVNEPYVFVSMISNGNGSYAIGGTDAITSIDFIDLDFTFDAVEYHDIMGRKILIDETLLSKSVSGIYIKSYLYEGKIVNTEKVIR